MSIKLFLAAAITSVCCLGELFGLGGDGKIPVVEGSLSFTITPVGLTGYTGTWEPVIISPDGEFKELGPVSCDSAAPIEYVFTCCGSNYVEIGCYEILLKNNIANATDVTFVDKVVVTTTYGIGETFPPITYRHICPSSEGENILLYYILPFMEE